ncbi:MAG: tyrosine-type recombinase/integrase [Clostridiales bacterium]|nr:tyrosine-type recombinase/integrase [Clostridiales bacterium]
MKDYKDAVSYLRKYLTENNYGKTVVMANERCFCRLEAYLTDEDVDYTPEKAEEWFCKHGNQLAPTDLDHCRIALMRLRDIYECGEVRAEHDSKCLKSYTVLSDELKNSLETFLSDIGGDLSPRTVSNYRHTCARFLIFMQKNGIRKVRDITFDLLLSFYESDEHSGRWEKRRVVAHSSTMMEYFFRSGVLPYGCCILFHYLSLGKGCFWNALSADAHEKILAVMSAGETVSTRRLYEYKEVLLQNHVDHEYNKNTLSANNRAVDLLILFLDMNSYAYSPEIAEVWFQETGHWFKDEADTIHRALFMVADYHRSGKIQLEKVYHVKPRAFDLLPEWCRQDANGYLIEKEKEGWAKSTLDMIRSSICRFCSYLDSSGLRSFLDLSVEYVKAFNMADMHKTPQGKNAYNSRIRKFLMYLGEHGKLSNPMLFIALPRTSAPKETIVVVLTKEEMAQLKEQLDSDSSALSLRKKAMLLLGLKMGMRSSDIVNLKIDDINWSKASIRFVQKKTEVEVELPMPTEVGNALFRYITEERHKKATANVFLSEKAPHKPVGRAVCGRALETALPDRDVEGSGFHVTRKTYATNLLQKGIGANVVAEALGQRGTTSVHRYLSLDIERMRMCSLSQAECGIGGWSDGR